MKSLLDEGHGGVEGVYTILSKMSSKQEERPERRSPRKPEPEWPRVTAAARGRRNPEPRPRGKLVRGAGRQRLRGGRPAVGPETRTLPVSKTGLSGPVSQTSLVTYG